jgi:hypothetical protein
VVVAVSVCPVMVPVTVDHTVDGIVVVPLVSVEGTVVDEATVVVVPIVTVGL